MNNPVKINFKLQPDSDGYPPVAVESVWANPIGMQFEIDSIPFFTCDATFGDIVCALPDETGTLWFDSIEYRSPRSLIRIVFLKLDCEQSVSKKLRDLGCSIEGLQAFKLLAVDIPFEVKLDTVRDLLTTEARAGNIDYEEALLRHAG